MSWSAEKIHNLVRGLAMGPHATTKLNGLNYKIHQTKVNMALQASAGTIVDIHKNHFTVACGSGALEIWQLQPESKKRMGVEEFLRGFSINKGDCFGT